MATRYGAPEYLHPYRRLMEKQAKGSVRAALALRGRDAFMLALNTIDGRHWSVAFHKRPVPLGMLGGLSALYFDVTGDGIWKFLDQDEGTGFRETVEWCKRIGARQAVAYLHDVAALFPRGVVPRDARRRATVVARLAEDTSLRKPADALRKLDRKYAGAMREVADKLRAWLRTHEAETERALEKVPAKRRREAEAARASALARDIRVQKRQGKREAARRERVARGSGKADVSSLARRVAALSTAAEAFTPEQWLEVAQRYDANAPTTHRAAERSMHIFLELVRGRVHGADGFTEAKRDALAHREAAIAATERLPESVRTAQGAFPLKSAAHKVLVEASIALLTYEWLCADGGADLAASLLRPFEGFAPLPADL